jgi:hypothetical protein
VGGQPATGLPERTQQQCNTGDGGENDDDWMLRAPPSPKYDERTSFFYTVTGRVSEISESIQSLFAAACMLVPGHLRPKLF